MYDGRRGGTCAGIHQVRADSEGDVNVLGAYTGAVERV